MVEDIFVGLCGAGAPVGEGRSLAPGCILIPPRGAGARATR